MPTMTAEDYIKAIYKLQREGGRVTTSALAECLEVADATVTDMIKKLSDRGLIHYARYQGVGLTPRGRRMALKIVRRHRLWEMYLVEFLGYSWDQVHGEAERLEHVTSDDLEQRLDEALGFPGRDPHGDPIPDVHGGIDQPDLAALSEHEVGDMVRVLRVSDENPHLLRHASQLGLELNRRLTVIRKLSFDGSMAVKVGRKKHFLSKEVAGAIFVESVS